MAGLGQVAGRAKVWKRLVRREASLFAALERFVNWDGKQESFAALGLSNPADASAPNFFPREILYSGMEITGRKYTTTDFARELRDYLRDVWDGKDSSGDKLAYLLGIASWVKSDLYNAARGSPWINHGLTIANWKAGALEYAPEGDFATVVYLLLRKSWKGRRCDWKDCRRYFIAGKQGNRFCSQKCSWEGEKERKRKWWRVSGSQAVHASAYSGKGRKAKN